MWLSRPGYPLIFLTWRGSSTVSLSMRCCVHLRLLLAWLCTATSVVVDYGVSDPVLDYGTSIARPARLRAQRGRTGGGRGILASISVLGACRVASLPGTRHVSAGRCAVVP